MKKILLGCLLLLSLVQACRKYNDTTQNGPIPTENIKSSLTGQVIDENGNPVAGAWVLLENGNGQMTDAKGMFFYHDQLLNKNGAYIKVEKAGYFTSARFSFQQLNGASMMEVQLIPKKLAGTFDAASGGQFSFDNGAEVTIPASGLVTTSGATYSGTVKAYAVWLDPSQQRTFDQMPGDLRAIDANGNGKILTTYGMIGVELEGGAGEKLQIAPNQKAKIALTVPSSLQNTAPATIPLWHFDESNGYWKEEGSATLNNGRYEGEVSHFSFWNWDEPGDLVIFSGKVVGGTGEGISGISVHLIRPEGVLGTGKTDANGYFSGPVPANEIFTIKVSDECGQSYYTDQIGPFTENVTLDPIIVTNVTIATFSGTVVDCNGQPLAYSSIVMNPLSGIISPVVGLSDSDGAYSIHFVKCAPAIAASITAYDGPQAFQSPPQTVEIISNATTIDPLIVCTAPDEYLQMNIDGNLKVIVIDLYFDSVYVNGLSYGYIIGNNLDSNRIQISFRDLNNGQATVSGISGLYVDPTVPLPIDFGCSYYEGSGCLPTDTEPIQFTNVPTAPGEYAIGSAVGNVLVGNVLKPYSLSFRIKQ